MHNQTISGLFKMCRLPQELKNSSSILQKCIESTLKGINGVEIIFLKNVLFYGSTKEQFDKRILAVESRLREKNLILVTKNLTQNQSKELIFLDTPLQRREQHWIINMLKQKQKHQQTTNNSNSLLRYYCLRKNNT